MTDLPLHQQLAIEQTLRSVQRGEMTSIQGIASLIQRFPGIEQRPERGLEHPLCRIVMECPEGRELVKRLGLNL